MALLPMYPGKVNSPVTELVSDIDEVQDTIEVSDGLALPDAPNIAVIGTGEDAETIQYGDKSGNVLSDVVRGFQGVAKAWSAGQKVARNFTAYDYDALRQNLKSHGSEHNHDGSDPIPDLVQLRDDLNDIKTPDPSYTPDRPIDKPGDMTRDMQKQFITHLDETVSDGVHGMRSAAAQDYEEGEWTPQSTGNNFTNNTGTYIKVGSKVVCFYDVTVTGSGTGAIRMTDFPFVFSKRYGVITWSPAQANADAPYQWNWTPDIHKKDGTQATVASVTGKRFVGYFMCEI